MTVGGAHATVSSITGTTYGAVSYASSNTSILTVNSSTGEVTPVSNGTAKVTVSWAGDASHCAKDVDVNFTVNKASATIKLSEAGSERVVDGTHYSGDSYTLPTTTEATCSGKVLVGWSKVEVEETDTKPIGNYYDKGTAVALVAGENKFYAVFATASAGGGSNTESVTWSDKYSANTVVEGSELPIGTNAKVTHNKGTNNNNCQYYTTGQGIRVYGGGNFVVTAPGNITAIDLSFGSGDGTNAITTDVGTYTNGSWAGSATSVTFSVGGTTGHRRISGISVTYSGGTTYSNYATSCCTPLAQVEGSANLSQWNAGVHIY